MKHSNPNMVPAVLEGIEAGEAMAGTTVGDELLAATQEEADQLSNQLVAQRTGRFLPVWQLAKHQGFIAAYRSATEFR